MGVVGDAGEMGLFKVREKNELSSRGRSQRKRHCASMGERSRSEKAARRDPDSSTFWTRQN